MVRGEHRTISQRAALLAGILFATLVPRSAHCCPYGIRDAGFIVKDPEPYAVVLFVTQQSPLSVAEVRALVEKAADESLRDSNVEARLVDVDGEPAPEDLVLWQQLDDELRQRALPAALIAPDDRILTLPEPPQSKSQEAWKRFFDSVVRSPARTEISNNIIQRWCVIVIMRGADPGENARAMEAAKAAGRKIIGFDPEMHDVIQEPPYVVAVQHDDPGERILLWSLQLRETNPRSARVALLFGHGRRLGPPLAGDEINEPNITSALKLLGRNCTCTSQPQKILGPTIPRVWGRNRRTEVYDALGFDPNSPNVVNTLAGVWTDLLDSDEERTPGEYLPEPGTGYIEFPVHEPEDAADESAPPEGELGRRDQFGSIIERQGMRALIITAAVVTFIIIAAGAFLVFKYRSNL